MYATVRAAYEKLRRDLPKLSTRQLAAKGVNYAGGLLRAQLYLRRLTHVGAGVRVLGRLRIENLGRITVGRNTLLRGIITPIELATGPNGELKIGAQCSINYGCSLGATGSITIGDRVRLGPYTMVVDTDFHHPLRRAERPAPRPVTIASDVWLGAKVSIMPGVTIGRGAIVGTGAVVTRDVEAFTVVGGVPAKRIKTLDAAAFEPEQDY